MTRLLTPDEVSEYLRIHKRTLYQMIYDREIAAIKVGSAWRFKPEHLDAYEAQNLRQPDAMVRTARSQQQRKQRRRRAA